MRMKRSHAHETSIQCDRMQCGDLRRGHVQSLAPADSGGHLLSPAPARGGSHFGHVLQQSLKGSLTVVTSGTVTCTRCRHLRSLAPTSSGGYLLQSLAATRTCGGVTCGHLLQRAVGSRPVICSSGQWRLLVGVTCGALAVGSHAVTCSSGQWRLLAGVSCGALAVGSRAVTCSSGQWRLLAGFTCIAFAVGSRAVTCSSGQWRLLVGVTCGAPAVGSRAVT